MARRDQEQKRASDELKRFREELKRAGDEGRDFGRNLAAGASRAALGERGATAAAETAGKIAALGAVVVTITPLVQAFGSGLKDVSDLFAPIGNALEGAAQKVGGIVDTLTVIETATGRATAQFQPFIDAGIQVSDEAIRQAAEIERRRAEAQAELRRRVAAVTAAKAVTDPARAALGLNGPGGQ